MYLYKESNFWEIKVNILNMLNSEFLKWINKLIKLEEIQYKDELRPATKIFSEKITKDTIKYSQNIWIEN